MDQTEKIRQRLVDVITAFMEEERKNHKFKTRWKKPLVGFADAKGEGFARLREIVTEGHYQAEDFLPEANVVVSYFLPFNVLVPESNVGGRIASEDWSTAYSETNSMAGRLNDHLVEALGRMGYRAAVPQDILMIPGILKSNWSQRHIAYLAGLGTFGLNNMLITEEGCCGRFFSVVADIPVIPDHPRELEACLYKRDGSCCLCTRACPTGALRIENFDREACQQMCDENQAFSGSDCCGKCLVGLPCSTRTP